MVSLLEEFPQDPAYQNYIWQASKIPDAFQKPLIQQRLRFYKNGSLKEKCFALYPPYLYKLNKQSFPLKRFEIEFKTVNFFTDSFESHELFGFSLSDQSSSFDFYVLSEESLAEWKKQLMKFCFLTGFSTDFLVIKKIGEGKSGKVYLVEDTETGEQYAMKSILKHDLTGKLKDSIISEIKILRGLNHPNIVQLHRVYNNKKNIKLILDYCKHGSLFSRLTQKHKFKEAAVKFIAQKLLDAIFYMHSKKIIHRDIKLENILMTSADDTGVKIADFGLACEFNQTKLLKCGSPGYVAPEILRSRAYSEKVDIFSLGVVVYAMLSGSMPFAGPGQQEILMNNCRCNVSFSRNMWNNVSFKGVELVSKMMEKNPEDRPNVQEVLADCWLDTVRQKKDASPITRIYTGASP